MDEREKKKKEFLTLLSEATPKAASLEATAKEVAQSARLIHDVSKPLQTVFENTPARELTVAEWDNNVNGWKAWHANADKSITTISTLGATTAAATNTAFSGMTITGGPPYVLITIPKDGDPEPVRVAREDLANILRQSDTAEAVRRKIKQLTLDVAPTGRASALDHYEKGFNALSSNGGSVAVFISIRECIVTCISELLRRRPVQEPARSWAEKILSLGNQCAKAGLDSNHFKRLAYETDHIIGFLSGVGKQSILNRTEMHRHFDKAALYLVSLLESFEEQKLKAS